MTDDLTMVLDRKQVEFALRNQKKTSFALIFELLAAFPDEIKTVDYHHGDRTWTLTFTTMQDLILWKLEHL